MLQEPRDFARIETVIERVRELAIESGQGGRVERARDFAGELVRGGGVWEARFSHKHRSGVTFTG